MVRHLFSTRGGHGTCFAYGQTGSGKTVTMMGLGPADRGGNAQASPTPSLTPTPTLALPLTPPLTLTPTLPLALPLTPTGPVRPRS